MAELKAAIPSMVLAISMCVTMSAGYYEYFQLVQQWPPTLCRNVNCRQTNIPQIFSIHGVWPSNYSNIFVNSTTCVGNGAATFNRTRMNADVSLIRKLRISWPDIEKANNLQFWQGQWNKHGICSGHVFGQQQYFDNSDGVYYKHNITGILQRIINGGSKQRSYRDIEAPIQLATGKIPLLRCKRKTGNWMLQEVVLCYDHGLTNLIDCNATHTTCRYPFTF